MSNKFITIHGRRVSLTKDEIEAGLLLTHRYAVGLDKNEELELIDLRKTKGGRRLKVGTVTLHSSGKYNATWYHNNQRISLGYYGTVPHAYSAVRRFLRDLLLKLNKKGVDENLSLKDQRLFVVVKKKEVYITPEDISEVALRIKENTHCYINGRVNIIYKNEKAEGESKYYVALTRWDTYVVRIPLNGRLYHVGKYPTAEKAEEMGDRFVRDILVQIDRGEIYGR